MSLKLTGEILRWFFTMVGAVLFVYGFVWGRWDAAVLGLLLMLFGIAISLKLSIMKVKEKIGMQ